MRHGGKLPGVLAVPLADEVRKLAVQAVENAHGQERRISQYQAEAVEQSEHGRRDQPGLNQTADHPQRHGQQVSASQGADQYEQCANAGGRRRGEGLGNVVHLDDVRRGFQRHHDRTLGARRRRRRLSRFPRATRHRILRFRRVHNVPCTTLAALRAASRISQSSRTAPLPPAPTHIAHDFPHAGLRVGGAGRQSHALQKGHVEPVVSHVRKLVPVCAELRPQRVGGRDLVAAAEHRVRNAQLLRPCGRDRRVLGRDPSNFDAAGAQQRQAGGVVRVKAFEGFALAAVIHRAVGQHAVDVEAEQANARRPAGQVFVD